MFPLHFISIFFLMASCLTCATASTQNTSASKAEKKATNICLSYKLCEYEGITSQCGRLVINFHKSWKTHEPAKSFSSLKKLVEKEGATIELLDKELGIRDYDSLL